MLNWPGYVAARVGKSILGIIEKRKEQGQCPPFVREWEEHNRGNMPSLRSIVMARPGWCMVEADYCTAEMRGLAFISGDMDLMKLLLEPDDCFGVPKPECVPAGIDPDDCAVRLKFPKYVTKPADKEKFLLTYAHDDKIVATFTEDQLIRNPDGSLKHRGFDMHWGVTELARGVAREVMNKKKDRGAGKTTNFCLAKDTPVLTDSGYKPIQAVQLADKLWDGEKWVEHKGIQCFGKQFTILYDGIRATPDHRVWTVEGHTTLLQAAAKNLMLVRSAEQGKPIQAKAKEDKISCLTSELFDKLTPVLSTRKRVEVYDLLDAGDNHRFTANDRLVSNSSSYGGTARSIARKIEQDTGNKLTEEEAQALLDAVESRQPRATAFFHEMERIPYEVGYMRAKSGRVRHCLTLAKDTQGLSSRQWESQVTALGRECRNFYLQESVGASASRACVKAVQFYMTMKEKYGLQGYLCVCLYDSLVIHCPEEERHIWQLAIDLFMHLSTGWRYNDRILNYTIDLELNAGWSFKPDKEWAIKLHDPNYKPTPEKLKALENLLEMQCAFYRENKKFSIYPPEDMDYDNNKPNQ